MKIQYCNIYVTQSTHARNARTQGGHSGSELQSDVCVTHPHTGYLDGVTGGSLVFDRRCGVFEALALR